MNRTISQILADNNGEVPAYAWPGGYECYFITKDGGVLCHQCVEQNLEQIKEAESEGNWDAQWAVIACENLSMNESELICDHCGRVIDHGWYTVERVQEELPDVPVKFNGREVIGHIKGRQLDHPAVWIEVDGQHYHRFYAWESIQDVLNCDSHLILETV